MKSTLVLSVIAALSLSTGANAQDAAAGKTAFNKCMACHAVGEGARNKMGPHLNGVVGRTAGALEDYNYSKAMQESDLVWDEATLTEFLKAPRQVVPGTKMAFPGVKSDEEIANLIAYMAQFEADGTLAE